jgi:hypothetical protein
MTLVSILDLDDTARVIWVDSYSTNVFWVDFEDAKGRRALVGIDLSIRVTDRGRISSPWTPSISHLLVLALVV